MLHRQHKEGGTHDLYIESTHTNTSNTNQSRKGRGGGGAWGGRLTGYTGHKFERPEDPDGPEGPEVHAVLLLGCGGALLLLMREEGDVPAGAGLATLHSLTAWRRFHKSHDIVPLRISHFVH